MKAWLPIMTIIVLGLLPADSAFAGIEDSIGLGTRATAMGGALTSQPGDFSATYYNPAALSPGGDHADEAGFVDLSFGFVFARPVLDITALDGADVEPVTETPDSMGLLIGTRFDLGTVFNLSGLNVGVALYLPPDFFRWTIHPDDQVQWLFHSDRSQVIGIHAGMGYRITDWLSVGAGLRVLFDTQTLTLGRVTDTRLEEGPDGESSLGVSTQLGEDVKVFGRVSPTAGLLVTPTPALTIGLTFRGETFVDDWGYTRIQGVPGLGDLGYNHHFAHYYQPLQVAFGASYQLASVSLSAEATYRRWSEGSTTNLNTFGEGQFGDTLTPAAGMSWHFKPGMDLMAGFQYVPSPFDNFGGPTNLLDNDRSVFSTGMSYRLGELFDRPDLDLAIHWAFQLSWLHERVEEKDFRRFESDADLLSNPGFPGYRYSGVIPAGSLSIEVGW